MTTRTTTMISLRWLRVVVALTPVALSSFSGCQSVLSKRQSGGQLTERQKSLAETPLALAKAKKNQNAGAQQTSATVATRIGANDAAKSQSANAATNKMNPGAGASSRVQLASAVGKNSTAGPASATDREVVHAVGSSTQSDKVKQSPVVPAQYASGSEAGVDSFSVPREPMPNSYGAYVPSPSGNIGSQSRNASGFQVGQYAPIYAGPTSNVVPHGNSQGQVQHHGGQAGHGQPGHSCPTCNHGSGVYTPMFPQFNGINGASHCPDPNALCPPNGANYGAYLPPPRQYDPQEHLFDGGDHEPLVRVRKDNSLSGLDPEDTVVQYQTVDGETHVESGCRVAIYAPRFASVRKRLSTAQNDFAQRLRTTDRPDGPNMVVEKLPSKDLSLPLRSQNKELVRVVEAVRDRKTPLPAETVLPMLEVGEFLQPYADLSLFRTGVLNNKDEAKLAVGLANARAWVQVEELNVFVDGQEAIEMSSAQRAQGVIVYEHKGARIRLCKVASENLANPGDIVSFTIRVDNTGEQPLSNLVITDSLTPRLEFIEGTDKSSLNASFSKAPNSVGSEVLRWEISDVLKPGEGGVVRFDCRVR